MAPPRAWHQHRSRTGTGTILFVALSHGEEVGSRAVEATCGTEKLSVPGTEELGPFNDWVVFGTEHHTLELHMTASGTLAIRSISGGYGLALLIIPAGESRSYWYRYARSDKPQDAAPVAARP